MRLLNYLRYYLYIGWHWNWRIARHMIRQEKRGEKKYGLRTTGADELGHLRKKGVDTSHATIYMPAGYDLLENLFAQVNLSVCRHFIDIGSGKGRVMVVAAHHGARKITGIEFAPRFCAAARTQLAATALVIPGFEYQVINNDAFYVDIPDDADCLFMFNPFDEVIMSAVADNIAESHARNPRKITLLYANPLQRECLEDIGFTEVYHTITLKYLEAIIMELQANP